MAKSFPLIKGNSESSFRIDLTSDPDYIDQAFSLRYQVFNLELGEGLASSHQKQRDTDQFDDYCDHLVVINQQTDQVVGTYRIMPYQRAVDNIGFYSETEFDLTNIYHNLKNSAEMGRCCVHKDFRSGLVMNLLWYGLAKYMETNQVNFLFGCTSLNKGDSAEKASVIYKVCQKVGAIADPSISVEPQPGFAVKNFNPDIELPQLSGNPKRLLPSLLRGYLSVGTKICGEPAYDPEFDVIDFFSVFHYDGIAQAAKRFFSNS